jgi:drug/metabolite transporter (DMT)-like permease
MSAPYGKTVMTGKGADGPAAGTGPVPPGGHSPGQLTGRSPALLAVLGAATISASAILIKLADTGVATAAVYRCLLALPLLLVLAAVEQRRRGRRDRSARAGAVVAGLCLSVDLVLWNHAIAEVGAGVATLLGNLSVVFVTVIAWVVFRERPRLRFLLALPIVMVGVVLVAGVVDSPGSGNGHAVAGIWYGLGTSVAYAAFLLILRHSSGRAPHVAGPLSDAVLGAAAGSLLLGLAFGGLQFRVPWPSFGWLLILAISSQVIGWLLITSSLPRLPAAVSSLLLLLQPAASLLLAAVVLAERPSLLQLAGAVLVCGGVLLASRSRPAGPPVQPKLAGPTAPAPRPAEVAVPAREPAGPAAPAPR